MEAIDKHPFEEYLGKQNEQVWVETLNLIYSDIHQVDRDATQIWFSFWPLKLAQVLDKEKTLEDTFKKFQLDGNPQLREQIDDSVKYLFGARFWVPVKKAVLTYSKENVDPKGMSLDQHILKLSREIGNQLSVESGLLTGIVAISLMILKQVGFLSLRVVADQLIPINNVKSLHKVLKSREVNGGLRNILGWKSKMHQVIFDEGKRTSVFEAADGQDLSMASNGDKRDFLSQDSRKIAGPVPAQCRSGACGYCWIGVLAGQNNLSKVTEFEKGRLEYFGYSSPGDDIKEHPVIRLACQSKCYGKVSITVPPWNGVLYTEDGDSD